MTQKLSKFFVLTIVLLTITACLSGKPTAKQTVSPARVNDPGNAVKNSGKNSEENRAEKKTQPIAAVSPKVFSIKGKYFYADTTGVGGEYTFEFKENNFAALEILEEDATTTGSGSWSWDAEKEVLTATLSVKLELAGDEPKDAAISQKTFQFKKTGKNFKVIKADDYRQLIGAIFKK